MTEAEKRLWEHIRNRQLENCKFRRQYSVAAFAIDFYSPEIKLALEVDGDSHFVDGALEYDVERQAFIESARIKFLRFTNEDVYHNLDGVLEVIVEGIKSLRTSGVLPPPSPPLLRGGVRLSFSSSAKGGLELSFSPLTKEELVLSFPPLTKGGLGGVIIC